MTTTEERARNAYELWRSKMEMRDSMLKWEGLPKEMKEIWIKVTTYITIGVQQEIMQWVKEGVEEYIKENERNSR